MPLHTLALTLIFVIISAIPSIPSAFATTYGLMTPSIPKAATIDNLPAIEEMVGQQLMITTTGRSNLREATSYATIIEARDPDGVTMAVN